MAERMFPTPSRFYNVAQYRHCRGLAADIQPPRDGLGGTGPPGRSASARGIA